MTVVISPSSNLCSMASKKTPNSWRSPPTEPLVSGYDLRTRRSMSAMSGCCPNMPTVLAAEYTVTANFIGSSPFAGVTFSYALYASRNMFLFLGSMSVSRSCRIMRPSGPWSSNIGTLSGSIMIRSWEAMYWVVVL